jgi:CubicO group peptidase (beta-lactamase class C family)
MISSGVSSFIPMGRSIRTALLALLVSVALAQQAAGQSLTFSLLERYLESLRQQSGIPGLSAAVVQNGAVVWEKGFGLADVEHSIAAQPYTPYHIGDLTEALSSMLLLEQCVETGHLTLDDRLQQWIPSFAESGTTIRDILSHRSPNGTFKYDAGRYATLTGVIEKCIQKDPTPFRQAITEKIFERLGMVDSVPAQNVDDASTDDRAIFSDGQLERFGGVLKRMALPYRVSGGSASVNPSVGKSLTAATGAISTVRDLARYDGALDDPLLHRDTMAAMWANAPNANGAAMPTGLGWFVQNYNGQRLYWQFGLTPGAYSSLLVKVPGKNITLILLANSDGLSAPFALQDGDVNDSLFARAFLRLFVG